MNNSNKPIVCKFIKPTRIFGCRRRIALTDAADMENVSKKRCSVDLVFLLAIQR